MLTPLSLQPTQVGATQDKPGQEKSFRCEGLACPRNTLIVTRDETLGPRFESARQLFLSPVSPRRYARKSPTSIRKTSQLVGVVREPTQPRTPLLCGYASVHTSL
jgi:hypothetical protein